MATPRTEAPKTETPKAPEKNDAKAKSAVDILAAKKAELAELQAKHELSLVQAEIDKLKNGGLTPAAVKRRDTALAKQAATTKETQSDGKVLALYELSEKSYKATSPGSPATVLERGTIIRISNERLPGESMLAVVPDEAKPAPKFKRAV